MFSPAELERRMDRVRVLLDTHDDIYDDLSRNESAGAKSGFGEPVRRSYTCGDCAGEGCGRCENRGRVVVEERDPYDTGIGAFDPKARDQREDAIRVERILERIREDELMRAGVISRVDFETMLRRADSRDRRGSYRELRASLDRMPRLLHGEDAVRWLATVGMPKTIRVPRWAFERELDELRGQVVALKKDAGLDVSEIATQLAISKRQVRVLLKEARS